MPCKLKECECKAKNVSMTDRIRCRHWFPSQSSKYFTCELYELEKVPCPFQDSPCETCEYYAKLEGKGRPNHSGIDWNDPEQVREYKRRKYHESKRQPTSGT